MERKRLRLRIIAFDLGRNFAYAHNITNGSPKAVHKVLPGETRAHRFGALTTWLEEIFAGLPELDAVVYETPFARGRDATRSLWGYAGIIEARASLARLPVVDVAVPTIKKFAALHGKASKNDMLAAARTFGYEGDDEHEADAVCLLKYAEANLERGGQS